MSDDAHLIEQRVSSERVFDGKLLHVRRDTVRLPDGGLATREYVVHPGAVLIVPVLPDGRLVVERQYRYPIGEVFIEFPAGKLDAGEAELATAQRELAEEAGVSAQDWRSLGVCLSSPGVFTERLHLFLATGLTPAATAHERAEVIEIHWLPLAQACRWAVDGTVADAKSALGLLRAAATLPTDGSVAAGIP
jgi:ADP-ribose pyrophosphatase